MKKILIFISLLFSFICQSQEQEQIVKGKVQSETSKAILQNVHVLNLTKVKGTITNNEGEFEINAKLNDTLYFSYIGYKPLKVVVTNDLIRFDENTIELTELAFALEEVIIKPYQLTGYLEIDVKNAPVNTSTRYRIIGLPNLGYEAGRRSRSGLSKVIGAIFNPADFLNNLFKQKSAKMDKLRLMREDSEIKNLLGYRLTHIDHIGNAAGNRVGQSNNGRLCRDGRGLGGLTGDLVGHLFVHHLHVVPR